MPSFARSRVRLEGASLTSKQVHAFCDHIDQLVRTRIFDSQTFTLLATPQSITAIGLCFMTSKVMACTPVDDWKTVWSVATNLKEYYPLDASDSFVSAYDKWLLLTKSTRKTIKVDQNNIAHCVTSSSPRPSDEYGNMPEEYEEELLGCFVNTFTYEHNPSRDFGSNREL